MPLGPLPAMGRRDRPSFTASSSAFDEVDESALDNLLGSDNEDVSARITKTQPRPRDRQPSASNPATGSLRRPDARRPSGLRNNLDDDDDADNSKADASDDDSPPTGIRRPGTRAPPARHNRPLPTKKAATGATTSTLADSMDAALFGLRPSSAMSSTSPLPPTMQEPDFSLTAPAEAHPPYTRSRSLTADRDPRLPPSSAASTDGDDAERKREQMRQVLQAPTPQDTPHQHRGRSLSIEMDTPSPAPPTAADTSAPSAGSGADDGASDRRARYREMMRKKREERSTAMADSPLPAHPPPPPPPPRPTTPGRRWTTRWPAWATAPPLPTK